MPRNLRLVPFLLALCAVPTSAQPAATGPSALEESKQCTTARKKEDREQRSLVSATESIARDKQGRENCSSKSMCARYDAAISDMEKRQSRHQTRLARFKEDTATACKAT